MLLARASLLAALLAAALRVPALAQDAAPAPSPSPSAIPEIGRVTTSDRRPEALSDATRPTFVIDRGTIEAFGSRDVADALAAVPGVSLFGYGPFGSTVNFGLRGTTSTQTLVLLDGVPIAAASNGQVDLGTFPTLGIARIEVVESGASTLYGTSATGGVINLISAPSGGPYLRISDGSYADRDVAAGVSLHDVGISFERHVALNAYDYPAFGTGASATPAGVRVNADAEQTALRASALVPLGGGWSARAGAGVDAIDAGVPGGLTFLTPVARQNISRSDAQLELAHALAGGTLSFTVSGSTQTLTYADPSIGGEQDTYDGRAGGALRYGFSGTRSDVVAGIDLGRESVLLSFPPAVPPTPAQTAAESQAAAYAQVGYRVGTAARLTFGLRGENDTPGGGVLAPSFGSSVALGALRLRANVGESFGVPTLVDLYYPGFSNPNLVPERLANYDATLTAPAGPVDVSFGYFGRDGSNLIVLDPNTFVPFNASRVSVNGAQLTLATRGARGLRLSAGVTDLYRALDTTTGLRFSNTPPLVATLSVEHPFERGPLAYGARVRVVGATPNDGPQPNLYDAYGDTDVYLRYRMAGAAILTLRMRNLNNDRYMPIFGYPAPGRTVEVEFATR